jgi:hypothetical protein
MKHVKTWSELAFMSMTLVLLTGFFSTIEQVKAQTTKDIENKKSLVVSCYYDSFSFNAVKLKEGDSKTVECVQAPGGKCTKSPDICLLTSPTHPDLAGNRVFYCNHDNPFAKVHYDTMHFNDYWKVICE